ncbi:MAG: PPK2 family polyphosphate kinase [Candidatus Limnocylindrales bacterium]
MSGPDPQAERPALRPILRVEPGERIHLRRLDPAATHGRTKADAATERRGVEKRLADLQERLFAESKHAVLVVLQGIDASGKNGTIRHAMNALDPSGVVVTGFRQPTDLELAHDFLWRVHQHTPAKGELAIFNRSHYESVLVERVHRLVPRRVWQRRYATINAFERLLTEEGTTIVKCFLHLSKDEQARRFQERVDDPRKHWKFRLDDLAERERWNAYEAAFEDALNRCSTPWAPWYVIPADHRWFRNLAVATILASTLEELHPRFPPSPDPLPSDLRVT